MKARLRPRLNYANVIATIALFAALSGVAVAAGLPKNSVGPNQIKRGAVNAAKLKKGAVTSAKLAPKSVTTGKLGANAVTPGNIGNGAVTSAKIGAGAVLASSIKNGVITTNKLQNEAITAAKLGKGSVTLAKLADEVAPLLGTLKSGQTLRGVFAAGGTATGAGNPLGFASVSYQFPLSGSAPAVSVLKKSATNANCAGIGSGSAPSATAGNLCIYLTDEVNLNETTPLEVVNNQRLGFGLVANAKEGGKFTAYGQWALTAP
ncbi:MAG: hypothetical protein JJE35_10585 [Thermoleophilia bacterium]|nr:hypothetical protein [Thermoleophilia bacterium]